VLDELAGIMAGAAEPLTLSGLLDRVRPSWMRDALCREHPEVDFFPHSRPYAALRICGDCLVRLPCLRYALENECVGVWGGTSEQDRRRMAHEVA
jgi:Transcription factor WhiB